MKRPQAQKVGNRALMAAMQEKRRSSAASPVPSGKAYSRSRKHRSRGWDS